MRMDRAHPRGARAALLARRGGPSARARLRGVGAIPGEGPRAPPAPPAAGSFPSEQMGQGSGGRRRRRAEKAIFSRYIFYKSNILCISALPVKASRAQPRDSAAEPVSQQRLAATWLLEGGTGWEEGSPMHRVTWGGPPDLWASSTQPGHSTCCKRRRSVVPAATVGFVPPGWHGEVGAHTLLLPSCLTLLEIKYPG